jgi:hypothetical protein
MTQNSSRALVKAGRRFNLKLRQGAEAQMTIDRRIKTLVAALGLLLLAKPVLADSIDGNWCYDDGRHFSIRGPEIVTPGGVSMEGNYSRHAFSYRTPASEPGAGQTIDMSLADENKVYLRRGTAAAETWRRCSPSISWRATVTVRRA